MTKILLWILLWLWIGIGSTYLTNFVWNFSSAQNISVVNIDQKQWIQDLKKELGQVKWTELQKFKNIIEVLEKWYMWNGTIASDKMLEWALHWFVDALNDPFTSYLDTVENKWLTDDLKWSQKFEWIGTVVSKKVDWIQIMEVLKWSPAHKAGIKPFDFVLEINGKKVDWLDLSQATSLIRGVRWTSVELLLYRAQDKKVLKKSVIRETISVPSVSSNTFEIWTGTRKATIWYINVSIFWDDTTAAFKKLLSELLNNQPIKWLIIDLRWNGWGYLAWAIDMASMLLPRWNLVTSTRYRLYPDERYESKWDDLIWYRPIVILVDGLTASASEVLAWALQYHKNAILVWTKTFGKWSIQTIYDFWDSSSLKYTIWKRDLPDWKNIDGKWLIPTSIVEFDDVLYREKWIDNQLEKAKEILRTTILK